MGCFKYRLLIVGCLGALAHPAIAAERDLFELSLEELGALEITGATLTARSLGNVPAAVTVFTRAEIRQLPVSTVEQLLNYVPGFQSARSSDTSISRPYSVRGRRFGASGREVLVMINGMRIENFFTGGAASTYAMMPLANVARVEFIRGPGSALYGSNALTGMINIVTEEQESALNLAAGQDDQYRGNWLHQIQGETVSGNLFVRGLKSNGDQYRVPDSFSPQQITTRDPYTGQDMLVRAKLGAHTHLQLLAVQRTTDDFYVTGFLSNGFNQYDTAYYHGMLEHSWQWTDSITSTLQLGYSDFTLEVNTQATPPGALSAISSPASDEPLKFRSEVISDEAWLQWRNDWELANHQSLQFGVSYRNPGIVDASINGNFDFAALYTEDYPVTYRADFGNRSTTVKPADMDISSAFVQYQSSLGEQADLVLGTRYDRYSQIGDSISPRVALTLYPTQAQSIKLLYGRAFDAPVAAELYTINNTILLGNPDLGPETIDTWEAIWLYQGQQTTLSAGYFYNRFHELINQTVVDGVRTYTNAEHETSDGVELELIAQPHPYLNLRASVTQLFTLPASGFRESEQLFSLVARLHNAKGYASLGITYQSEKDTLSNNGADRTTLGARWLADMKLGYYVAPELETYLEITNLADVDYATPSVTGSIDEGIPNPGRSGRLGATWYYSR